MALKAVRSRKQLGMTIIELMVASVVSLIAIGAVGTLYIKGLQATTARSQTLYLRQSVNDALRIIAEDMLRAGFSTTGSSLKLSGAVNVIEVSGPSMPVSGNALAYVFHELDETAPSTAAASITQVVFMEKAMSNNTVKFCYADLSLSSALKTNAEMLTACSGSAFSGKSLLPHQHMEVTKFEVIPRLVSTAAATTQEISIELGASFAGQTYNRSTVVTLRNWQ
uniref:PilW family protein n=1 Tax=Thaumasiovibrio occultus TaxID=1891184 RepID=UPI000D337BFB|nr:prepilin-type N-terminal cleavage/methylation domain-containing protein [Thaumasiovibrio occultus]